MRHPIVDSREELLPEPSPKTSNISNPSPSVAASEPSTPTLVALGIGCIDREQMDRMPNGAFMARRYNPIRETFAVKVNGMLIPTTEANAKACELIARRFGGNTKNWCEAWTIVQQIANQQKESKRIVP